MRFNDLKAALQPSLDDDLGKLYAEFVRQSGTGDLARFIGYLKEEGLVEPKLLEQLVSDGSIDSSAVQDLARQNTPRPAQGRLHAPTLMPAFDDDDDVEDSVAPESDEEPAAEEADESAAEEAEEPTAAEAEEPLVEEPAAAEESAAEVPTAEEAEEAAAEEAEEPATDEAEEPAAEEPAAAAAEEPGPVVEEPDVEAEAEIPPEVDEPEVEDHAGGVTHVAAAGASPEESVPSADAAADSDTASDTGSRPKRRSEAGSTGARRKTRDEARSTGGRRRTGERRTSSRTGTGARRRAGGSKGATGRGTSARDRLKRTMFSLRQQAQPDATDTTDILRRSYKFVGKVGEGAMGRVLKAKDNDLLRLVAYKEMSEEIASNAALASKFYAEAQITAQLDHPNIVPVYQLEQNDDGMLAYTMKLIKGKTVEDYIDEVKEAYQTHGKRKLPEEYTLEKRLEIFLRCCDALYYAHRRGVVHRDLKPENIMIGAYGEVYIMDWGIAKVVRSSDIIAEDPIELIYEPEEEPDLIIGTPQYMSPEQANGDNADLDHRSDQYSMGLILYELISCKQAVTGKSAMKIVMRQQDAEKDPLQHAFGDRIPRELRGIMEKCTTKAKDKRFEHIKAVGDDVRHFLRDEPVTAKPDSIPQALGRWIRRNTAVTAFVVLTLLFFAGVGVVTIGAGAAIYNFMEQSRQTKLNGLRSAVFAQSSMIDGQFIKYEGLLGTMTATASEKLTLSAADDDLSYYASGHFDGEVVDEEGNPVTVPGMANSKLYESELSLEFPVFHIPDDASDREKAERQLLKLANIGPNLRTVLLRSESEEAARFTPARYKRRIAQQGTPITWAFIGLDTGAYIHYPGRAGITGYDPREQPWYTDAKKNAQRQPGPRWSPPFPDYHGRGYVMTVSQPLYDVNDDFLGVAGVSLTFDYVIDTFLELPEGIKGVREVAILDEEGQVLISTEDRGKHPKGGRSAKKKRTPTFDAASVVDAIKKFEKAGLVEDEVDDTHSLVFYNRMEGLGWYLVVVGDPGEMLESDI